MCIQYVFKTYLPSFRPFSRLVISSSIVCFADLFSSFFFSVAYCNPANAQCANRVALAGDCTADSLSCVAGATCVNNVCTATAVPSGVPGARMRRNLQRRSNLCPESQTACSITGSTGFECIDTMVSQPFPFTALSPIPCFLLRLTLYPRTCRPISSNVDLVPPMEDWIAPCCPVLTLLVASRELARSGRVRLVSHTTPTPTLVSSLCSLEKMVLHIDRLLGRLPPPYLLHSVILV